MEAGLLETVGKAAGIGGIAIGVLLLLFRDVVRKNIFPKLSAKDAYRLLSRMTAGVFVVALAGIGAWIFVETRPAPPSAAVESAGDLSTDGNLSVRGGGDAPGVRSGADMNIGGDLTVDR